MGDPGVPPGDGPPPGGMPQKPGSAWRPVHPQPKRRKKGKGGGETGPSMPPPPPVPPQMATQHFPPSGGFDPRQQLAGSWATWQRKSSFSYKVERTTLINGLLANRELVTPPSVEPTLMVPGRQSPGLFGPRTPSTNSNSMYNR